MWKNFHRKVVAFDIYCQFVSEMLTPFAPYILTAANDISRKYYRNKRMNEWIYVYVWMRSEINKDGEIAKRSAFACASVSENNAERTIRKNKEWEQNIVACMKDTNEIGTIRNSSKQQGLNTHAHTGWGRETHMMLESIHHKHTYIMKNWGSEWGSERASEWDREKMRWHKSILRFWP